MFEMLAALYLIVLATAKMILSIYLVLRVLNRATNRWLVKDASLVKPITDEWVVTTLFLMAVVLAITR